jgi:hypothetical protein
LVPKLLNMESAPSNSATELVQNLENFCKSWSHPERADELILEFRKCHNTHQQSMMRVIYKLIEFLASDNFRADGRNEASKKAAQQMLAGFQQANGEGTLPSQSLPFI